MVKKKTPKGELGFVRGIFNRNDWSNLTDAEISDFRHAYRHTIPGKVKEADSPEFTAFMNWHRKNRARQVQMEKVDDGTPEGDRKLRNLRRRYEKEDQAAKEGNKMYGGKMKKNYAKGGGVRPTNY